MEDSNIMYRVKALSKLISEFKSEKYGIYVNNEICLLEQREKNEIGFQSEGDDVVLELSLDRATIEYNIWDDEANDDVFGKGDLEYDMVIQAIREVTLNKTNK